MTTDNSTVSPIVISKASDCWREAARGKARPATRVATDIACRTSKYQ